MVGVHSPAYFFYSGGPVYQKWNRVVLEADNKVHTYGYGSVLCPYL